MNLLKRLGVAVMLCAGWVWIAAAQEDVTRTGQEVLEESFEDVGADFDVLIEEEREDILNQRGTGGIGDDILVDAELPEDEAGGTVSLEDLVDFEVSVRGIPMPPGGGTSSSSEGGDPGMPMPQSGGQSGEGGEQGEAGQEGGEQGGEQGEGEGEGEGEQGEGAGEQGGEEGGEQEGQEQGGQQSGSGGGASAPGGEQRPGGSGGGGGNTSPDPDDIPDGQDDDIVARQLRELAENETDPELKEKLWDEYRRYKAGQ